MLGLAAKQRHLHRVNRLAQVRSRGYIADIAMQAAVVFNTQQACMFCGCEHVHAQPGSKVSAPAQSHLAGSTLLTEMIARHRVSAHVFVGRCKTSMLAMYKTLLLPARPGSKAMGSAQSKVAGSCGRMFMVSRRRPVVYPCAATHESLQSKHACSAWDAFNKGTQAMLNSI